MAEQHMLDGFNRDAVRVALTGSVRTAAPGTKIVGTDDKYDTDTHAQEGYLSPEGVTISFDENLQEFIPWQEASAVRTDIIEATTGVAYTLWETGPGRLAEYLGVKQEDIENLANGGTGFYTGSLPEFEHRQLCLDMFDKGKHQRVTFFDTQIAERGDIVLNKEGVYGLQITRRVYPAGREYAESQPEAVGNTAWWEFNRDWKNASNISTGVDGVAPLEITTANLAAGQVGTAYNVRIQATGGTAPYSWDLAQGTLPAGLELEADGTLAGTPTAAGTTEVTVRARDAKNLPASRRLSIEIEAEDAEGN